MLEIRRAVRRMFRAVFPGGYIPARKTVRAAAAAGLSVCDYVERLWGSVGRTQAVISRLGSAGVFFDGARIVEIGAGTGRYIEKTLHVCAPASYESYETDNGWARWLASTYPVVSQPADGCSLRHTAAADLVLAHGVFVYVPFLTVWRYWHEIWRIVVPGGVVVFDAFTEDCMPADTVRKWLDSENNYPCLLSRQYVVDQFAAKGFDLVDTFTSPYGEGESRYFIFRRVGTVEVAANLTPREARA